MLRVKFIVFIATKRLNVKKIQGVTATV
jgi:hypothetical protein